MISKLNMMGKICLIEEKLLKGNEPPQRPKPNFQTFFRKKTLKLDFKLVTGIFRHIISVT